MIAECKKILECVNSVIFISELDTGKLAYINQAGRNLLHLKGEEDYLGRDCSEFFGEFEEASEHSVAERDSSDWYMKRGQTFVKATNVHASASSTTFTKDGIRYQLVISDNSAEAIRQKKILDQTIENEIAVTDALSVAMEKEDPDDAINSLLLELGKGFKADRSYIFEENEDGGFDNTYEWCREGVTAEKGNLQNVSEKILVPWNNAFDRQGYLIIRNLEEYRSIDPEVYEVLKPQKIHSLIVSPLVTVSNKRVGFFGVDNPDPEKLESSEIILGVLGHFISSLIEHRKIIERLRYVSERDDLTKAYNRTTAGRLLDSIHDSNPYTMLLMDIDHIKSINEIYGTQFGDYVLQKITEKLNEYLRDFPAFLARYGSDEFLVVLRGKKVDEDDPFVTNLRNAVHTPVEIGTASVAPTVCIGITYSDGNAIAKEKVAEATRALQEAKRLGRASTAVYTEQMRREMEDEVAIKLQVRDAMKNDGFYMLYQPKVSVDTLEVIGYEALVRMKDSRISPAIFIPIALENGWLREIGRITTEKTIAEIDKWQKQGVDVKPVSINFSSVQVLDAGYFDFLMDSLSKHNVSPELIQIEITEQVMMKFSERALNLMGRFHQAGIKLLLDDFGTGYSSLSYINRIPLDTIKLDKSFVDNILNAEKNYNMVKDIILMGHDQGMHITAEGVETKEQFVCMKEILADSIQGYFFSKPLMPDDAVKFAANHCAKEKLL